jgi:ABC-type nitrate/sulfonate/bicarbonate transport system permease component
MNRRRDIGAGVATILLALAAWEVAIVAGFGNRTLLPPPSTILAVAFQVLVNGDVWGPVTVTLGRLLAGLGIATVVGTVLGILTGTFQVVEAIVEPSLEALRSLPKVALVPALILLVGIGNATNIVCIALAGVFPIWINVVAGVRRIDPVLHDSAVMLGMGRLSRLQKIVLPAVLPDIFAGVRVAMGICFVVAVLSEMTIGSDGLGSLIIDMQRSFRVRHMYAWIVILAALGVALNALIALGERHIVFWTRHANQNG